MHACVRRCAQEYVAEAKALQAEVAEKLAMVDTKIAQVQALKA
jgi:hypothetical protein